MILGPIDPLGHRHITGFVEMTVKLMPLTTIVAVGSALTVTVLFDELLKAPLETVQVYVVFVLGLTVILGVVAPPGIQRKVAPGAALVFAVSVMISPLQTLRLSGEMETLGTWAKSIPLTNRDKQKSKIRNIWSSDWFSMKYILKSKATLFRTIHQIETKRTSKKGGQGEIYLPF